MNKWLKITLEMGPLLIFFFANSRFGLVTATAAFMVALIVSLGIFYLHSRTIPPMLLIGGGFVGILGGLTIALDNDMFIKLKPTLFSLGMAAVLGAGLLCGKIFLRTLLDGSIKLTEQGWRLLSLLWIGYFVMLAGVNEIVWRTMDTDTWVSFKVFGILPLTLLFAVAQTPVLLRHQCTDQEEAETS
ncbi:septation protein A [Haematospirillum sp. H1815]|uniref:septation protein A n=1 Tax=Haematospirillum sp. H1815 TaxID=2723108 RepID=UPI00143BC613|nr:septation protein A [Haematospirillum sp. H1815]NKD77833.1 septation protein A [Haematospirillum sp. H1815]